MTTTCNVLSGDIQTEIIFSGAVNSEAVTLARPGEFVGGNPRLTPDTGSVGALFFSELERVGDGFIVSLEFERQGSESDGFAFIVQDERLTQLAGNGGPRLGINSEFDHYLAVGFDLCNQDDRDNCAGANQRIFIETRNDGAEPQVSAETSATDLFPANQNTFNVKIAYLDNVNEVQVFIGNNENPTVEATGIDLKAILTTPNNDADDGLFAHLGVSASTANSAVAGVFTLQDFTFQQMNSGFKLQDTSQQTVEFGATVSFSFEFVDTCNIPLTESIPQASTDVNLVAELIDETNSQLEPIQASISQTDAVVNLLFQTRPNIETTYQLQLTVDGVLVQGAPINQAVSTEIPSGGGLSTLGLALLVSLLAVLVIVVAVIVRGWYNYRKKLKEHAEDIEYGKTKQTIDNIDKEVDYQMNPMVAPLDKLKGRLAKNEATIKEMKENQQNALDSDYTVEQLQAENQKLREEMADLKRKQELEGAGNRMSSAFVRNVFGGRKKDEKADFDQEGA